MPRGVYKRKPVKERFDEKWEPDPETGCWKWTASKFKGGYGKFRLDGRMLYAHRIAWKLYRGEIPKGEGALGTCVCHKCDNPSCVNPDHLFLGTHNDNMEDRNKKGRAAKGSKHGRAKLSKKEVIEIRRLADEGTLTQREIGKLFGTAQHMVSKIKLRKRWKHL